MIPCLCITQYNRTDLTQRCVDSIDFPVERLYIVNNGPESLHQLKVPGTVSSWDEKVGQGNIGCAGAWNASISYALLTHRLPHVFIVGNDIAFTPGDLKAVHNGFVRNPKCDFLSANQAFGSWGITQSGFEKLGWVDENLSMAYVEDVDYFFRLKKRGDVNWVSVDTHLIHGEAPHWGSATVNSDPVLAAKVHVQHEKNWQYMQRKWGWNRSDHSAKFDHPFNDPTRGLNWWKLSEDRKQSPHFRQHG